MDRVVDVRCRSYSAGAFDGCAACVDAALDAVAQAVVYVLGRAVPELLPSREGRIGFEYNLRVRVFGEDEREIGADDLTVEQSIEAVPSDTEPPEYSIQPAEVEDDGAAEKPDAAGTMRLEDFQTVVDRLELAPEGEHCIRGQVAGSLFGYERTIGRFEALIQPH